MITCGLVVECQTLDVEVIGSGPTVIELHAIELVNFQEAVASDMTINLLIGLLGHNKTSNYLFLFFQWKSSKTIIL